MANEWVEINLGDVVQIMYGKDHKHLQNGLIPVYGSGGIMRYADCSLFDDESILIPRKGTLNNIIYVNKPFWTVDTMFWTKINKLKAYPKFLFYQLKLIDFTELNVGSAVPSLTVPVLNNISLFLPPLPIQQRIAGILGALDDKIELNRKQNETLEAMARALFKAWFVDFEPVRAKQDGRWQRGQSLPGLPAHLYDLFPDRLVDSELGEIPQGWGVGKVGELFNLTMGQSPPSETYNLVGTGMEFYQGSTDFGTRYPQPRVYCSTPSRIAHPGDTLVSVRAPVGTVNLAKRTCCLGRGVASIRHQSNATAYTYYSMLELKPAFSLFDSEGTVFGSINKANFENISVASHPISIIHAFEKTVKDIESRILNNDNEIITTTELRDSLLPKLLTGTFNL
jgi:type I restriction enzyme, S subunit